MERALIALLAASVVLCLGLVAFAVGRKLRRDRHEADSAQRRATYLTLVAAGDAAALAPVLRRIRHDELAKVDLWAALGRGWPGLDDARRDALAAAIETSGFGAALRRQVRGRDAVGRGLAIQLIGRLHLPDAWDLLAPRVNDRDGDVQLVAIRVIGELGTAESARLLIETLGAHIVTPERVIERLGTPWAVPTILDALERGGLGPNRILAEIPEHLAWQPIDASLARALGLAADPRAADALRRMLRVGGAEERVSAARSLGAIGDQGAVADLEAALEDAEWPVRAQAARALGMLGAEQAVPALAAHLGDKAWWVRGATAEALGKLGEPGVAALLSSLQSDDRYAHDRARETLDLLGVAGSDA